MQTTLVAVDGSEQALRAVREVVRRAALYSEYPVIHLLNVQLPVASGNVRWFINADKIAEYHHEEGMAALAGAREILDRAGLAYHYHIGVGPIAQTIARYAEEKGCDEIVAGARGAGNLASLFVGSVALKLLSLAKAPVLLVK